MKDIINLEMENIKEWIPINYNYSQFLKISSKIKMIILNLVSYNFPIGTYLGLLMDSESCNKDKYDIFDVKTNEIC